MERITRAAAVLGPRWSVRTSRLVTSISVLALTATILPATPAIAAGPLTSASVALSNPVPSQTSSYTFTGSSVDTATAILCVKVVWSSTSAGDTAPAGFSGAAGSVAAASSTLVNSNGTNWSLAKSDGAGSGGQNNVYKYTNSAAGYTPNSSPRTFVLAGLTNPSTPDTKYFFQIRTFGNTDCASSPIDHATVQFINTDGSVMSMNIDPTLTFSVSGVSTTTPCDGATTTNGSTATTLPFGSVSSATNGVLCQDLSAASNASGGYSIYLRHSGALTSGTHSITAHSGSNASPQAFPAAGTETYGYTTNDSSLAGSADRFTNPSQGWAALTLANEEIGYEATAADTTHYLIGHQVGVSPTTAAGDYQTTVVYTCIPVY